MDEVREFNSQLAQQVIKDPVQMLKLFQDQLNQTIKALSSEPSGKVANEKQAIA